MKSFTRNQVLEPFQQGNALKIISGLHQFNENIVKNVVVASNAGGASHIDIACNKDLVKLAKSISDLPICVSAIKPIDFVEAVNAGADMIEIGNFDTFYDFDIDFTAEDVLELTQQTRKLLPTIPLSVTIPHKLSLSQQIELAKELEAIGVDIIQTEGKVSANINGLGLQELIELAAPTIASAYAISRAVSIPVMCSSGLCDVTVPLALAAGAKGVGVGSMVNKQPHVQQMVLAVQAIALSMGRSISNGSSDYNSVDELDLSNINTSNLQKNSL
eukprot:gene20730-26874_t